MGEGSCYHSVRLCPSDFGNGGGCCGVVSNVIPPEILMMRTEIVLVAFVLMARPFVCEL